MSGNARREFTPFFDGDRRAVGREMAHFAAKNEASSACDRSGFED
jgi:hypothetical protein